MAQAYSLKELSREEARDVVKAVRDGVAADEKRLRPYARAHAESVRRSLLFGWLFVVFGVFYVTIAIATGHGANAILGGFAVVLGLLAVRYRRSATNAVEANSP